MNSRGYLTGRVWALLLGLTAICGCVTIPTTPAAMRGLTDNRCAAMQNLTGEEKDLSGDKNLSGAQWNNHLGRYEDYLEEENFDRTISEYTEKLRADIKSLESGDQQSKISEDAMAAFPFIYYRRYTAYLLALQGAARCRINLGDYAKAEEYIKRAVEISNRQALSPASRAISDMETQNLAIRIYKGRGETGKSLIAKLNRDLMKEYLGSPKAVEHYFADKKLIYSSEYQKKYESLQEAVDKVSEARLAQANAQAMAVVGGLLQGGLAGMNFMNSINSDSGISKMMGSFQFASDVMKISLDVGAAISEINARMDTLEGVGEAEAINVLANKDMGANSDGIIRGFLDAVVQAGDAAELKPAAAMVNARMGKVLQVRGSGNRDATVKALSSFAEAFANFQNKAAEVK